jgi:hypothetical protein
MVGSALDDPHGKDLGARIRGRIEDAPVEQ